jgi:hypothetical protein
MKEDRGGREVGSREMRERMETDRQPCNLDFTKKKRKNPLFKTLYSVFQSSMAHF